MKAQAGARDKAHRHRSDDNALENMAQDVALTEPVQPVLGKGRAVGNRVIEIEPAEPPVCEVEHHLLAQFSLRAEAEAVADDKHPDQQLGINRRPPNVAVEWTQLFVQIAKHRCYENVDPAQQVALRDHVFEPEFIKKARLLSMLSPHHRRIFPLSFNQQESSFGPSRKHFFDSIDPIRTFHVCGESAEPRWQMPKLNRNTLPSFALRSADSISWFCPRAMTANLFVFSRQNGSIRVS